MLPATDSAAVGLGIGPAVQSGILLRDRARARSSFRLHLDAEAPVRALTLPDGSQWTMETLSDDPHPGEGGGKRRARVSRARSYVWVRCVGDGVERRLMFASAWELWSDRQLTTALADALTRRLEPRPHAGGPVDSVAIG